jgi:hypothetical protein
MVTASAAPQLAHLVEHDLDGAGVLTLRASHIEARRRLPHRYRRGLGLCGVERGPRGIHAARELVLILRLARGI